MTRLQAERMAALALLAFSLGYFLLAFTIKVPPGPDDSPFSARSFPFGLGALGMLLSFLLIVRPASDETVGTAGFAWARALGLLALMGVFALGIDFLGFVVASALFLAAGFRILGEKRPAVLVPVAIGTALGFWIMFELLDVKLDWGVFGRILG
ncbi:MAG: tripartite tricarboxylate transporter TctB family protein [Tagaea sp.]|nr:tripartite tricarboxylate transporter TctB family protein [Tagaea sp.]